ncbi:MAG: PH domain-containing protein [Clostridia bacterium]|nr:PH domain-containing protein [Clostridia bacterium]
MAKIEEVKEEFVWKDRKRPVFGLPLSFTRYRLTEEKLIVDVGFFSRKEEEVRLYRVLDISLSRPLSQRIFRVGTIHVCTADKTTPEFEIKKVKHAKQIKNMLSDMIEKQRDLKRVASREYISGGGHEEVSDMGGVDIDGDGIPD